MADSLPTAAPRTGLFARKSIGALMAQADGADSAGHTLRRTLGPVSLVSLGIGCIIGAGLFSLTGVVAADNAGPAVVISYLIAAVGCALAGMCYSELSSMIPVSGSAYTYAYATLGELVAWIIGWDLVLEYAVAAAAVAVSWSSYVVSLFAGWGINLPARFVLSPWATAIVDGHTVHGFINVPAVFIVAVLSLLLIRGISESAFVNNVLVVVKLIVVAVVIGVGVFFVKAANYHPFLPPNDGTFGHFGISGVMRGAGVIFFAYVGFDAVSTAAQETRNPQRDMPIGILGSLGICTVLYVAFGLVLTGLVKYTVFKGDASPVATVVDHMPYFWLRAPVKLGIIPHAVPLPPDLHGRHRPARRPHPDRGARRDDLHRHAARLRHRLHRRAGPAPHRPRPEARLPHPLRALRPHRRRRGVRGHDGLAGLADLGAAVRVARNRPGRLFHLQPPQQPGAPSLT
jgi:APA family basic amino acid/polyamine antiporter